MENSIYLGLSRQITLQTNMDIIANNVANMSTPGFRGQNLVFSEFISDPRGAEDPMSFVIDRGAYQLTEAGPVRTTGNPLNVALAGPGFLGAQRPGGEIGYTRAGNFQLSPEGTLITAAGLPVASAGGGTISIPRESSEINIDERGFISNQNGQVGQLMVVEFDNLQNLEPAGDNTYITAAAAQEPVNTTVKQGQLEGSNVKPVVEMTRMIKTLRSFQNVQNILQTENERLRTAIQQLTRQG